MYYFGGAVVVVLVTSEERDEWVVVSVFPFWFGGAGAGVVVVVECGVGWVGYEWMLGDVCRCFAGPGTSEVNPEYNKLRGNTLKKSVQIP